MSAQGVAPPPGKGGPPGKFSGYTHDHIEKLLIENISCIYGPK